MNPAQDRGVRKASRDIVQALVAVVGAGGAYALIDLIVGSVNPAYGIMLAFFFKILVTYAQNYLETKGKIPVLLPSPGLVTNTAGGVISEVVGTVDAVADTPTSVVGEVLNVSGKVVGGVAGAVGSLKGG
jgi:uncharacterized membrane protein YjjP (DUF1212 family)